RGVETWAGVFLGSDQIDGRNLPVLGMDVGSRVTPPLRAGRMIESDDEIVLGTATLADLGKHIGDTVRAGDGRTLRIVGTATLPTIGVVHGDHTSLGIGGLVETKRVPGYDRNITDTGEYGPNVVLVRFRPGADHAAATRRVSKALDRMGDYPGALDISSVQRPAEVVNANDIGSSPTLLGVAVALAAMSALVLALTAAVRGRRRDLALLKALGFTRRQLSATVACQTTATVLTGLLVGVPVGAALGRLLWGMFAQQLNVLAEPTTPVAAIGVVIVASVALANLLSFIPAHFARTVPASVSLRSE
ncbi:MAG: putative transport system permease protein, partial [Gaiellales bacterium]|nr:putative transport system permease protein [Gaiellales bacterium]